MAQPISPLHPKQQHLRPACQRQLSDRNRETSYCERLSPHQRLLGPQEVIELNQDLFTVLNSHVQGGSMSLALNTRTPNSPPPD